MRYFLFLIIGVFFFTSCQNTEEIGEPPEFVLKRYQSFIDKNQFEEAKKLSTSEEIKRLEELAQYMASEISNEATVLNTIFVRVHCQERATYARCACELKDQYEEYEADYILVKIKGRWLVDAPMEEGDVFEGDMIDEIMHGG